MPRHPHEPTEKTRSEVGALASYGVPHDEISSYVGITKKTLYKYYREELDNSHIKANAAVSRFLYQSASGAGMSKGATYSDCVRAAMFWAKTRMRWRETGEEAPEKSEAIVINIIDAKKPDADTAT